MGLMARFAGLPTSGDLYLFLHTHEHASYINII